MNNDDLTGAFADFRAIPVARLRELRENIRQSQGWSAGETDAERTAIVAEWD